MEQADFRKLVSGEYNRRGAGLLRFSLELAGKLYDRIIRIRNFMYNMRLLKAHRVPAKVISVGNITVGGTGKTPLVIWLYKQIISVAPVAILTRGYKAAKIIKHKTQSYDDEPAILAKGCPQAKVIVNPDRLVAAAQAVNKFGAKVLIMDDGFQHRRLARDLDIVTIDGMCPFGHEKLLPAGLLREPPGSLKRADAVVITRCELSNEVELSDLEKRLKLINPEMLIARSIHSAVCARQLGGKKISIDDLRYKKIFAFCGIGNPEAFFGTIKRTGAHLIGRRIYDDHYHYTDSDISDIYNQATELKADLILSTQKDWYKTTLLASAKNDIPFAYLQIELKFISGQDKLKQLINSALEGKISQK